MEDILAPRAAGETNNEYKRRRLLAVMGWVHQFHKEHGHSRIPEGVARAGRTDVREFWVTLKGTNASPDRANLPDFVRDQLDRMAAAGVDVTPEPLRPPENPVPPGESDHIPFLQAIAAFIERHGHDNIPPHAVTRAGGLTYGIKANVWRRAYVDGTLSPWLTERLNAIPGWKWSLSGGTGRRRAVAVVVPDDTTQMKTTGLRQFLPDA